MATHIPNAACSVSASSSSSSPFNIKIEQVLNPPSSSASTDPLPPSQSSVTTTASCSLYPPQPPAPPTPSSLLIPLSTTLHISESPAAAHNHLPEYRNHKVDILPSSSSTLPEQSMAAAVAVPQPTHAMQPFTRPIRFVANDGQPHAKRRRISAACKTCRKRKTRCSGEKPACDTCRQNGHSCLGYSDPAPSTPSHSPQQQQQQQQQHQQQRQQENRQVPPKSVHTPAATTPTDKPTAKEHFYLSSPSISPKDRRIPQGTDSAPQPCDLPSNQHEQRGKNVLSRRQSQKRKSVDHQDKNDKDNIWNMNDGNEGQSSVGMTDEGLSSDLRYRTPPATQRLVDRHPHRIPYFRYFGPTAIVPGYKQMVVEVKDQSNWARHTSYSISASSSSTSPTSKFANFDSSPTPTASISLESIPFYDPNDSSPNNPLIAHLVEIFFINLGCNFPFLNRETFTRDIKDKRVDVILVDAVCAVAARFSTNPLLQATLQSGGRKGSKETQMCEYGTAFANRAKSQVVDTFACPKLSTVQACILLAYVEFGSNRDSGLWMFLGLAIRMAQDLGLHKFEGMRGDAKGREEEEMRMRSRSTGSEEENQGDRMGYEMQRNDEEARIQEQERTDTFWAVFFLDRVISSGTGRPVTIRAEEVEIDFPKEETSSAFPPPFPALIKIVHLYGRITDLLNSINDKHKIAKDTFTRLSEMEAELTGIYQHLSQNLHFNVTNFRQYSSTNQGSVFLLLHIWFHALIVLLHRPTLLIAFEGRVQELFPNSRELSMSSAKTISDILWFAETIDPRAVNGNPFSSQPIYIAACAFLQDRLEHSSSNPASRTPSPAPSRLLNRFDSFGLAPASIGRNSTEGLVSPVSNSGATVMGCESDLASDSKNKNNMEGVQKKHALLAQVAHGNYQKCYKALKGLEVYWEGVRYILTVLDQKTKGIVDPLLYTKEEMEGVEVPRLTPGRLGRFRGLTPADLRDSGPAFVKIEEGTQIPPAGSLYGSGGRTSEPMPSSFGGNLHGESNQSIELLTATGTSNSPNMHLTWLITNNDLHNYQQNHFVTPTTHQGSILHDERNELQSSMHPPPHNNHHHGTPTPTVSPTSKYPLAGSTPASDAEMLLGLSAGSKADYGQHHHDNGQGMDVMTMGGYTDGNYQTSGGQANFEYEMMSENFNLNNISWNLNCLEYMPAPYWPDPSFSTASQ